MLSSVLITFEEKEEFYIRAVLREIRKSHALSIKRIAIGQLFEKKAASIFVPESQIQDVFDKLVANEVHIYPFNEEYEARIKSTIEKLRLSSKFQQDKIRAEYFRSRRKSGIINSGSSRIHHTNQKTSIPKTVKEIPSEIKNSLNKIDIHNSVNEPLDLHVKEGNYVVIRNMVKNNPLHNEQIKEKYIPSIKSAIKIHLEKGLKNKSYIDTAISKLKEIICDVEIKAITSEDLTELAGKALLSLCCEANNEELINIINMSSIGQRINVMAAIKLSEIIFEEGSGTDETLLKFAKEKINRRFLLSSYDVMEPIISELNKSRFNLLINSLQEMAA